ncbi:MAG: type VI secretion system protein [Fibrobacter sp.]|nr:type VI secretion system protein [Fibrobacter sp.]
MDTMTPHQLVETALDALNRATAMVEQNEENRLVISGIEKASLLLRTIVPSLSETGIEKSVQEQDRYVYNPVVFDVDAMLMPIPGNDPVGINARLSGDVNNLLSYVVNRMRVANFQPDYSGLFTKAKQLLLEQTKDLGIAVRLIEAGTDQYGFNAIADGLLLINGLFSNFWEKLYPQSEDEDWEARANELEKLEELLIARLTTRYGQLHEYSPQYNDQAAAEHDAAVFKVITVQFDKLEKIIQERFDDQAPNLTELRNHLWGFRDRINLQCDIFRQNINQEKMAASLEKEQSITTVFESFERENEQRKAADIPANSCFVSLEPNDITDAIVRTDTCANYFVEKSPGDPLGYLVHRVCKWFTNTAYDSTGIITEDRRNKITEAFALQQWSDVLKESEIVFTEGGHNWLDLQRFQVTAAQCLGTDYDTVAYFISSATVDYVSANRKILDEKLDDGTPCASPETIEWIRTAMANRGSGQSNNIFGGRSYSYYVNELEQAEELAAKGSVGAGMNLLHSRLQQASCRREQFLWRILLAEFCLGNGLKEIALAAIDHLVESVEKYNLLEWEDPELFTRVYKIGYSGYRSLGEKKAPVEKLEFFRRRICLYDPKYTIAS